MATLRVTNLKILLMADDRPQYVIAALAEVSPTQLSQFAIGAKDIPLNVHLNLARVLGVTYEEIDGWVDLDTADQT